MCDALKRLIVHKSLFENVGEGLKAVVASKSVGDPQNEKTDIGPLAAQRPLALLEAQVADAVQQGAKVVIGGSRPESLKGAYYQPTIVTNVTRNMRIWHEEVFGPVLPVMSFTNEDEAIALANDTKYGLGSYMYTKDKTRAQRVATALDTGMVSINQQSYIMPCNPFGGNKMSGQGREHGKFGFAELTKVKVVAVSR